MSSKWTDATGFDREHQEVRLLDYACGSGTVSKVCLSIEYPRFLNTPSVEKSIVFLNR